VGGEGGGRVGSWEWEQERGVRGVRRENKAGGLGREEGAGGRRRVAKGSGVWIGVSRRYRGGGGRHKSDKEKKNKMSRYMMLCCALLAPHSWQVPSEHYSWCAGNTSLFGIDKQGEQDLM
jgi:hypothetical protein